MPSDANNYYIFLLSTLYTELMRRLEAMVAHKFRFATILLVISLFSLLILPASSVPEADGDGHQPEIFSRQNWYYDCSNATGFELNQTWDLSWNDFWEIIESPIQSDGEKISLSTIRPTGNQLWWYGPVYMFRLPLNFTLGNFISLTLDTEIENGYSSSYEINCYVHLIDADYNPLISLQWTDNSDRETMMTFAIKYWTTSLFSYTYASSPIRNETLSYSSTITYSRDHGIRFSIPTAENRCLWNPVDEELSRTVTHIALMYGRRGASLPVNTYLDGINLEFDCPLAQLAEFNNALPPGDSIPKGLLQPLDISNVALWGIVFVSAVVIIVFSSMIVKHPKNIR